MSATRPATSKNEQPRARLAKLLAAMLLVSSCAWGQAQPPLAERLADIREINRFVPERALPMLQAIEKEARRGARADKAEMLAEMCSAYTWLAKYEPAQAYCEELIVLGRTERDRAVEAKGLLLKGHLKYAQNELAASHALIWAAERLGNATTDTDLRFRLAIGSAEAYGEAGNFPRALEGMQRTLTYARQHRMDKQEVIALEGLAKLYVKMNDFAKGGAVLEEAMARAGSRMSAGRLASLKYTEYSVAVGMGQLRRALAAQLEVLALQRRIGALSAIPYTLVNLSDCYLKMGDYRNAIVYGNATLAASRGLEDEVVPAAALMNIGMAEIGSGQVAAGKRHFERGLATYEQGGDKAELQMVLLEYGNALERARDHAGALKAYHRERRLSGELFEERRQKAVLELQEKYEGDRKQRQIELLETENRAKSAELDNRRLQQRIWWLLALVFGLASIVVGMLYRKVRHANAQLHLKNAELEQQSMRDPLTGLYNRRHFQASMRSYRCTEKRGAGTSGEEMVGALFLMDVDHFKHINDTWGHGAGDAVLVRIAASLREILRETDMIVRWGGEEFLAFLPAIPRSGLDEVARRLLNGIAAIEIEHGGMTLSARVSIGYAPHPLAPGGAALPWERALNLVDMALYMAKSHGRNRAYGVRGFPRGGRVTIDAIEQDLEQAWRHGQVELAIVTGDNAAAAGTAPIDTLAAT